MSEYQYNKVTPEMIEKFKEIAPKRVLVGDEINEDFTHDEMAIYGKARPEVLVEATSTEEVAAVVVICAIIIGVIVAVLDVGIQYGIQALVG